MHIAIHCGGMPFNGATIDAGKSLGGSESAAYYMAKELAALDHHVVVLTNEKQPGKWDGVTYEWLGTQSREQPLGDRAHFVLQAPFDVVIAQRHPLAFIRPLNSNLNLWWLHDLALYRTGNLVQHHLHNIDRILTVSEFHRSQVSEVWGIDKEFIVPTTNGVDYGQFQGFNEFDRDPRSLVFAARPERGLQELVDKDGIMEKLTDCHLYVCGYDNTTPNMAAFYHYLWSRCDELPNVTNLGPLGKRELYELLARSQLYVYPTTFEDTSCIMVLEANAAGTPFVGCEWAALPETSKGGGVVLLPLAEKKSENREQKAENGQRQVDKKAFAKTVRKILAHPDMWNKLHHKALEKRQSWRSAAEQWDKVFDELLAAKCANKLRLHKHLERMSDIVALGKDCGDDVAKIKKSLPDFEENYGFLITGKFKGHYERYYAYERDRGVVYGPEDLTNNARFEQTAQIVGTLKPKTVLDYGCAHGHYVMNLAKRFPDILFCGVDINESNIQTARKWANQEYRKTIQHEPLFHRGEVDAIDRQPESEGFDLIIAAETLEHVLDPGGLVDKLMAHLNPGGSMLISVPYGPWEALGYEEHPGWRAHIHHLERADLFELFGNQEHYRLMVVPFRENFGHFIVTFQASGKPCGKIDYERKLRRQAPRETLSVCMIVKDGEHSLGRTLKTVRGIANEIIVGIDKTTTDETWRVAADFRAYAIEVDPPLETGFDAARNLTIAAATMDWILWIDSDETLEDPKNIEKFLRPNCYAGYAIKQHHYAADPPAVIRTDLPVRLFRNHRDIKFYGIVHEHPEKTLNDGVGKVIVLPDTAIMHMGYSTETVRRKRFERNFPLMQRDRKMYPDRKLSKFLWVRDLAHMCRYTLEKNGGQLTPDIRKMAVEGIDTWRELIAHKDVRMSCEALRYYSELVHLMKNGDGIEFSVRMEAKKRQSHANMPPEPLRGLFYNNADIKALCDLLVNENLRYYEQYYF
ncbi:MAG: methyltransferase domain-containing protein [Planctomycetota bacterium]|jgi:glycosyltransferase involved in cell wall biosynthesis/2-polyprenyl-3-methyl-5-hydroxy-6-metoxy-1,4-benzoquinol methylase